MGTALSLHSGDIVFFGTHTKTGKPEEWVVLMTNQQQKTALIAATESAVRIPYAKSDNNVRNVPVSWKNSCVRKWLNHDYYEHFSWQEQEAIRFITMPEDENEERPAMDNIFILSEGEASLFFGNDEDRVLLCNHEYNCRLRDGWRNSCYWWLRETAVKNEKTGNYQIPVCSDTGSLGEMLDVDSILPGVRPCMWVNICALRKVVNPGLEALDIRLLEKNRDSLVVFRDGREQAMKILAEFVDYDLNQTFAVLHDGAAGGPVLARVKVDFFIKSKLEDKYEPLIDTLKYRPYHGIMDMFQRSRDEMKIAAWMEQKAWESTPGYYQPGISDRGNCLIQLGTNRLDQYNDAKPLLWRVIKRDSNKILCVCEEGVVLDGMMDDFCEEGLEDEYSWETSTIRKWLNEDFMETVFSEDEEMRILACRTVEETLIEPSLHDYVFLLSDAEVSVFMPKEQERIIRGTPSRMTLDSGYPQPADENVDNSWWLRTPGRKAENFCVINPDGTIDRDGRNGRSETCAVRPAILVELNDVDIPYIIM